MWIPPNKVRCANDAYLPNRMLCGPWTDDKLYLLRRLLRWGAIAGPQGKQLAAKGLLTTIVEQRLDAARCLLRRSIGARVCHDHFVWAVKRGVSNQVIDLLLQERSWQRINWDDEDLADLVSQESWLKSNGRHLMESLKMYRQPDGEDLLFREWVCENTQYQDI